MTFVYIQKLSRRQQPAIAALLMHPTIKAAADEIGVNPVTLIRWMAQPLFQAAYREARYLVMEEAFSVLQKACTKAVDTILEIMGDREANAFARLHAARTILETAMRSRSIEELEDRIAALEEDSGADDTGALAEA